MQPVAVFMFLATLLMRLSQSVNQPLTLQYLNNYSLTLNLVHAITTDDATYTDLDD